MLQLGGAAALEGVDVTVGSEADGVPESERCLHSELILEGLPEGARVAGPVAPRGAGESVLEEEANNAHHGQAAVGNLGVQLLLLDLRVVRGDHLPAEVAIIRRSARDLLLGDLAEGHVRQDLRPARHGHLSDGCEAVRDVCELQVHGWRQVSWELAGDPRQLEINTESRVAGVASMSPFMERPTASKTRPNADVRKSGSPLEPPPPKIF